MLARLGVVLAALVVLAVAAYAVLALLRPVPAVAATVHEPAVRVDAARPVDAPRYGGSAITVLEDARGHVLSDGAVVRRGDRGSIEMASITKVVTALVVLDEHPLRAGGRGPLLEFDENDVARYRDTVANNGSAVPVRAGQTVRLRDALEVMLVESAGNWSESISVWAFGSERAFVDAAGEWLDEHGMRRTVVENPSGWQPNRSTTADLIRLGRIAHADPVVAELVAVNSAVVPGVGRIDSTNELLGHLGIDGIKTGTLDRYNLLFSADRTVAGERVTVVGVVLGAPSERALNRDVRTMLASVDRGFARVRVGGDRIASWSASWGARTEAEPVPPLRMRVWGDATPRVEVDAVPATVGGPAPTASLRVGVAGRTVVRSVVVDDALEAPDAWWLLAHPFD